MHPTFTSKFTTFIGIIGVTLCVIAVAFLLHGLMIKAFVANIVLNTLIVCIPFIAFLITIKEVYDIHDASRRLNRILESRLMTGFPRMFQSTVQLVHKRLRNEPSTESDRSFESVREAMFHQRSLLKYMINLCVLLGLLGTFWGLIDTLSSISTILHTLHPKDDGSVLFTSLITSLSEPLQGIGLAFSASLFGLSSSLVIGLYELFLKRAQYVFIREFEHWIRSGPQATKEIPVSLDELLEAFHKLNGILSEGANGKRAVDTMENLTEGIKNLIQHVREEQQMIRSWVDSQSIREQHLFKLLEQFNHEHAP